MHLKEYLSHHTKGTIFVTEFLQGIKSIANELANVITSMDDVNLVIHTLDDIG